MIARRLHFGGCCDLHFGLTTPNLGESQVNRAMVQSAREKILVADSSKVWKDFPSIAISMERFTICLSGSKVAAVFRRRKLAYVLSVK